MCQRQTSKFDYYHCRLRGGFSHTPMAAGNSKKLSLSIHPLFEARFNPFRLRNPTSRPYPEPRTIIYRRPSTAQCASARPASPPKRPVSFSPIQSSPDVLASGLLLYRRRAIDNRRNGNPNPSFPPASAEMNSRRCLRTYLSAKGPLAIAWERTGSMQITQEPIINAVN